MAPVAFYHNCIFQTFWQFSTWKWAKLALIYLKRHLQHDIHVYHVLGHFCSVMRGIRLFRLRLVSPTEVRLSVLPFAYRLGIVTTTAAPAVNQFF